MNKRTTIQKVLILEAVRSMCDHPTADEVYNAVSTKCPNVSKATVYRNLKLLSGEGDILRVAVVHGPDIFDRNVSPHFHFKCVCCGKVSDFNIICANELSIPEKYPAGYDVTGYEMIFFGRCPNCAGARKNQ
ncbi:MAG: transcriptional repressor [Oscillospiraceae bacterium]|nr:transcriptional repressor [Oscillospiraceae bacterium]